MYQSRVYHYQDLIATIINVSEETENFMTQLNNISKESLFTVLRKNVKQFYSNQKGIIIFVSDKKLKI